MRSVVAVLALALIWVLLWGSASAANVLSGLAVGTLLVLVVPELRRRDGPRVRFRPVAIARLAGLVLLTLVRSNVELTRTVLRRHPRLAPGVIGVPLPDCADEVITLLTNLLALSPGTMPIELRHDPVVLYVHIMQLDDPEAVRYEILRLTDLTVRAVGSDEAILEQAAYMAAHAATRSEPPS